VRHGRNSKVEPVSLRLLQPDLPRDLDIICLKCLEKNPAKRYGTAQELAEELGRFLRGEPIHAQPVSAVEKLWRWCQRKPVVASLIAALHVVGVLGLTAVLWEWKQARDHAAARLKALEVTERLLYASDMRIAQKAWETSNREVVRQLLDQHRPQPGQEDSRGFEWRLLWRLWHENVRSVFYPHPGGTVQSATFSSDGERFATLIAAKASARLWKSGLPSVPEAEFTNAGSIAFSPTARFLALGTTAGAVSLWDPETKQEIGRLECSTNPVCRLAFSPQGETLACAASEPIVKLWTVSTRTLAGTLAHNAPVRTLAFSPNGTILATGDADSQIHLWNVAVRQEIASFKVPHAFVNSFAFTPDGRTLAIPAEHILYL
jgi:eukaryotic-like serine/threonine-protein kinase